MPLHFDSVNPPIHPGSSVKFGGYRMKQFTVPLSRVGEGNYLADQVNQFLALNQDLTVVGTTSNWKESVGRAEALLFTLIYREGGARQYAVRFQSTSTTSAEDLASQFFALNTAFKPMYTTIISPPNDQVNDKKLLVIYQSMNDFARSCAMVPSPGAPYGDVVMSGFGDMQDPININRADVLAVNLGNDVWPDGGVNLLFNNVDACPDASAVCCFGGIAPCCEIDNPIAENTPPTIIEICCGCYPADLITLTTTLPTQTTVPTTTESTTETFPTTTTSTTQPTPPTTTSTTSTSTTTSTTTTTGTTTTSTTSTTTPPPVVCPSTAELSGVCPAGNYFGTYEVLAGVPTIEFPDFAIVLEYIGGVWEKTSVPCPPTDTLSESSFDLFCASSGPSVFLEFQDPFCDNCIWYVDVPGNPPP